LVALKRKREDDHHSNEFVKKSDLEAMLKKFKPEKTPGSTTCSRFYTDSVQDRIATVPFESFGFDLNGFSFTPSTKFFKNIPDPFDPETVFQKYFVNELDTHKLGAPLLRGLDTSTNNYLNGRKPDVSFFPASLDTSKKLDAVDVVLCGEIKPRKSSNDIGNNTALGEIVTFSHEVIASSPNRNFCYSFITNCEDIIFIKSTYNLNNGEYSYLKTPPYKIQIEGGKFLSALLTRSYDELGWKPNFQTMDGNILKAIEKVGTGATSTVWRINGQVVKQYRHDFRDILELESTILGSLDFEGVPKIVAKGQDFLVMKPFGTSVEKGKITKSQLQSLIKILRQAHKKGVIHRDIRWSNLLTNEKGEIMLIDWGFAISSSSFGAYKGCLTYAADDVLQALLKSPQVASYPKHDLHMLSRMIYHEKVGGNMVTDLQTAEGIRHLSKFWVQAFSTGVWKVIHEKCENLDYDGLSILLSDFVSF
jgi:hypothetical protein